MPKRTKVREARGDAESDEISRFLLGWLDSNQRMAESKSAALPLGYTPMVFAFGENRDIVSLHWCHRFLR